MVKRLIRQKFLGDKRRWTVYEIEREGEKPRFKGGSDFIKVYQDSTGVWRDYIPKHLPKSVGWMLIPKRKLKKVI